MVLAPTIPYNFAIIAPPGRSAGNGGNAALSELAQAHSRMIFFVGKIQGHKRLWMCGAGHPVADPHLGIRFQHQAVDRLVRCQPLQPNQRVDVFQSLGVQPAPDPRRLYGAFFKDPFGLRIALHASPGYRHVGRLISRCCYQGLQG